MKEKFHILFLQRRVNVMTKSDKKIAVNARIYDHLLHFCDDKICLVLWSFNTGLTTLRGKENMIP